MKIKNLAELRKIGKVELHDEIEFEIKNKKLFYEIRGGSSGLYLSNTCEHNSKIFELLKLDKLKFCDNIYGYPCKREVEFPNAHIHDFKAIYNVIEALYLEIERQSVQTDTEPKQYRLARKLGCFEKGEVFTGLQHQIIMNKACSVEFDTEIKIKKQDIPSFIADGTIEEVPKLRKWDRELAQGLFYYLDCKRSNTSTTLEEDINEYEKKHNIE